MLLMACVAVVFMEEIQEAKMEMKSTVHRKLCSNLQHATDFVGSTSGAAESPPLLAPPPTPSLPAPPPTPPPASAHPNSTSQGDGAPSSNVSNARATNSRVTVATIVSPKYASQGEKVAASLFKHVSGPYDLVISRQLDAPPRMQNCTYSNKLCGWSGKTTLIAELIEMKLAAAQSETTNDVIMFLDASTEVMESFDAAEIAGVLGENDVACMTESGGCNLGILIIRISRKMSLFFRHVSSIVDKGFWDQGTFAYLARLPYGNYINDHKAQYEAFFGVLQSPPIAVITNLGSLDPHHVSRKMRKYYNG